MKKILHQRGFTLVELMIVVAIVGMLVLFALPAYQDYVAKSQASEGFILLQGLKAPIAEKIGVSGLQEGCIISNGEISSGKYVAQIEADGSTSPTCMLTATYAAANVNSEIQNKTSMLAYNSSTGLWTCSSTIPARLIPSACR